MEVTTARRKRSQRRVLRPRANPRTPRTTASPAAKRSQKTREKANSRAPTEDRESGGGGEGSTIEPTSTGEDGESSGEWTMNRAKEVKREPVCLKGCGASTPASSFPEQRSPASSREGRATSREGAESQAGDTVSSADTPSSFPLSPEVTTGHMRGQMQRAQTPSARTRDGTRSGVMAAITELQKCGEALLTEAEGSGVKFDIATEIEHEIQCGACDDFGLAAESTPHPGSLIMISVLQLVCTLVTSRVRHRT